MKLSWKVISSSFLSIAMISMSLGVAFAGTPVVHKLRLKFFYFQVDFKTRLFDGFWSSNPKIIQFSPQFHRIYWINTRKMVKSK